MSERQSQHFCPECSKPIHRTHRRLPDRVASLFVPLHRYKCYHCGWSGLRVSSRAGQPRSFRVNDVVRIIFVMLVLLLAIIIAVWLALQPWQTTDPNAKGPGVAHGEIAGARIIDLAPMILHLMNVPVPKDMDGRVLTEALVMQRPVETRAAVPASQPQIDFTPEEAAEVENRLRALGYLG